MRHRPRGGGALELHQDRRRLRMPDPDRQELVAVDGLQQHDRLLADHVEADAVDDHLLHERLLGWRARSKYRWTPPGRPRSRAREGAAEIQGACPWILGYAQVVTDFSQLTERAGRRLRETCLPGRLLRARPRQARGGRDRQGRVRQRPAMSPPRLRTRQEERPRGAVEIPARGRRVPVAGGGGEARRRANQVVVAPPSPRPPRRIRTSRRSCWARHRGMRSRCLRSARSASSRFEGV